MFAKQGSEKGFPEHILRKGILLVSVLIPILTIAQVEIADNPNYKPIHVEGIGRFKIDQSTTSVIDSISKESSVPVQEIIYPLGNIPGIMGTIKSTISIYELEKNSSDSNSDAHAMKQKDVRVFYINYYNTDDVNLSNIYLKFYQDTLIDFECHPIPSPDSSYTISEAFRKKYGEPGSVTTIKKSILCKNPNGDNFNYYDAISTISLWVAENKVISVFEYIDIAYPDCKAKTTHVFTITDDIKNKIVEENEKKLTGEPETEK